MTPPYAAIVLAGGTARRLGGQAKPELRLGGRRLLDLVLDSVQDAEPRVVVGPAMSVPAGVRVVREKPTGGGPVAGLAAGLAAVDADVELVAVLAADLPFLTRGVIVRLIHSVADGAVLVDDTGRDQLLIGAWSVPALQAAVERQPTVDGAPLYGVLGRLDAVRVSWQVAPGTPPPWWDCDRVEDLDQARRWLGETTDGGPA